MGHRAGGIARRVRGGVEGHAGGLGQAAGLVTIMKIIDVPQSGKLGTFISFRNRFGQFRRKYVVPKDPHSPAQMGVRSRFGRVSARWRVLTDEQRAAWNAASGQVSSRSHLGKSGRLTGCQLFVKINSNLAFIGQAQVDAPPDYPRFGANPVGNLIVTNARGAVAFKLSVPSVPSGNVLVWGTTPGSAGASVPGRFTFLGMLPNPVAGVSDITKLYVDRYGEPPPGMVIFIRTCQHIDGASDVPKLTSALVQKAF